MPSASSTSSIAARKTLVAAARRGPPRWSYARAYAVPATATGSATADRSSTNQALRPSRRRPTLRPGSTSPSVAPWGGSPSSTGKARARPVAAPARAARAATIRAAAGRADSATAPRAPDRYSVGERTSKKRGLVGMGSGGGRRPGYARERPSRERYAAPGWLQGDSKRSDEGRPDRYLAGLMSIVGSPRHSVRQMEPAAGGVRLTGGGDLLAAA